MELPLTTVFWGMLRKQGRIIHPALWRAPRLRGVLARLALLERIPLTPEGVPRDDVLGRGRFQPLLESVAPAPMMGTYFSSLR